MKILLANKIVRIIAAALCLTAFAGIGMILHHSSKAATPFLSFETEDGTLTNVSLVADGTASAGRAIRFGSGPVVTPSPSAFVHPGIIVDKADLDFVKAKLASGAQPWATALARAKAAKADNGSNVGMAYSSLSWTAHPVAYVGCGAFNNPDEGCYDETADAIAADTDALLWYYTGNTAYAQKSVQIMNAWSAVLISHKFDTTTYTNGLLQAAWGGEIWPRAAEIIRYTYTPAAGQPTLNVAQFSNMLNTAYLPQVIDGWKGGAANWLMSMAEATINIGIFTDNLATYNAGVASWQAQVPAIIYMKGDSNKWPALAGLPISPPGTVYDSSTTTAASMNTYWHNPTTYVNGLEGETCRDINHMSMGFAAMINSAETARIQGANLYGQEQARIVAGLELNTAYISAAVNGTNPPAGWVCPTSVDTTVGAWKNTFAMAYNEYANRKGLSLPNTAAYVKNIVDTSSYVDNNFMIDEVLTSTGTP